MQRAMGAFAVALSKSHRDAARSAEAFDRFNPKDRTLQESFSLAGTAAVRRQRNQIPEY